MDTKFTLRRLTEEEMLTELEYLRSPHSKLGWKRLIKDGQRYQVRYVENKVTIRMPSCASALAAMWAYHIDDAYKKPERAVPRVVEETCTFKELADIEYLRCPHNRTGYKGVYWKGLPDDTYLAYVYIDNKQLYLGSHKTPAGAALIIHRSHHPTQWKTAYEAESKRLDALPKIPPIDHAAIEYLKDPTLKCGYKYVRKLYKGHSYYAVIDREPTYRLTKCYPTAEQAAWAWHILAGEVAFRKANDLSETGKYVATMTARYIMLRDMVEERFRENNG